MAIGHLRSATKEVVDGSWYIGENLDRLKCNLIYDPSFVVVCNKDTTAWEDDHEWVQIVWVSPLQPIEELDVSAARLRNDFKIGNRGTVRADLTTKHQN